MDLFPLQVFFYKAQVVSGAPNEGTRNGIINDYAWLKRNELSKKLQIDYYKNLSECLIDE